MVKTVYHQKINKKRQFIRKNKVDVEESMSDKLAQLEKSQKRVEELFPEEKEPKKQDKRKKTAPKEKKKTYEEKQQERLLAQKRRRDVSSIFRQKTKSGQPLMKGRIELLYNKIVNSIK